ncbi:hypothetical protein ACSU04_01725 [Microbacterium sp. A84]
MDVPPPSESRIAHMVAGVVEWRLTDVRALIPAWVLRVVGQPADPWSPGGVPGWEYPPGTDIPGPLLRRGIVLARSEFD